MAERINDLLLPIVKGVGSERSYEMLAQSLQTLGGSGFLQDYPIEQYIRDAKIDTLYEGTTAIQGLDFFFRKMVRDQFQAITDLGGRDHRDREGRRGRRPARRRARASRQGARGRPGPHRRLGGWAMASQTDPPEIYKVGLNTTRLLMAIGDLIIGWLLLRRPRLPRGARGRRVGQGP